MPQYYVKAPLENPVCRDCVDLVGHNAVNEYPTDIFFFKQSFGYWHSFDNDLNVGGLTNCLITQMTLTCIDIQIQM